MTFISRRDLLKRAAAAGAAPLTASGGSLFPAAAATPASPTEPAHGSPTPAAGPNAASEHVGQDAARPARREPLEHLTAAEADLLDAIVARLIPTDANGPGATEARAVHYIDRALGGALAASRQAYASGLAAVDRYAQSSRGSGFVALAADAQDAVLGEIERGAATGFTGSSSTFFAMLLNHTHQGTFGDPYYGGNANFVGWDLLGYPGVRTMVTAADQEKLEHNNLAPNHKSAYDYDTFTRASARATETSPEPPASVRRGQAER
jgi:gluconate 2-dehydrogenase gamma chain